jgi:hypothetical protein
MWKDILNAIINVAIFLGTLITILCLVVFMFVTSEAWLAVLSGIGAANALFVYDRYRRKT